MNALPKAVAEQAKKAEELHKKVYVPDLEEGDSEQPKSGVQAESSEQPVEEVPSAQPPESEETWEQRYKSLQGVYQSQVPQLQNEIKQLNEDLERTRQLIAQMETPSAAPKAEKTPASTQQFITQADIEDYGSDLVDFAKRAAREAVAEELNALRTENANLKQMVTGVTQDVSQTTEAHLQEELTRLVPDWRKLNTDPRFLQWIAEVDPYSGRPRHPLMLDAYDKRDAARVAAFFNGYLSEMKTVSLSESPGQAPQPQAQVDLGNLVAPGKPRAGATPVETQEDQKIWTSAEIRKFYQDSADGKYRHDPERKAQIERQIFESTKKFGVAP